MPRYLTNRPLHIEAWKNASALPNGYPMVLPEGSELLKVPDGMGNPMFVVRSVDLLVRLTGNRHDAEHRYVVVPDDAVMIVQEPVPVPPPAATKDAPHALA